MARPPIHDSMPNHLQPVSEWTAEGGVRDHRERQPMRDCRRDREDE
jgi:hypothetical protein